MFKVERIEEVLRLISKEKRGGNEKCVLPSQTTFETFKMAYGVRSTVQLYQCPYAYVMTECCVWFGFGTCRNRKAYESGVRSNLMNLFIMIVCKCSLRVLPSMTSATRIENEIP